MYVLWHQREISFEIKENIFITVLYPIQQKPYGTYREF